LEERSLGLRERDLAATGAGCAGDFLVAIPLRYQSYGIIRHWAMILHRGLGGRHPTRSKHRQVGSLHD
jgi:hypothetical protein